MKITINTDVLRKYNLSLGQFIVLLSSYYDIVYPKIQKELVEKGFAEKNLFEDYPLIISDNTKKLVTRIIVESDERVQNCAIHDFDALAEELQNCFPEGIKAGKTYSWRGEKEDIIQKLQTLVTRYNFVFTEEEAINAVKEYVASFQSPYTYMHTLKNFLLFVKKENGKFEMESLFMSIIENNREKQNENDVQ